MAPPSQSPEHVSLRVGSGSADVERLRHAVARLARLLRQQDEGGLGATATGALASVCTRGAMTLGELATSEQVAPPTMTRIIEKLSALGYVSRQVDPADRRVSHVTVTAAGRRYFESTRQRRRSWLAARMERLDHDQRARLVDALDVLELLGAVDAEPGAPAALVAEGQAR